MNNDVIKEDKLNYVLVEGPDDSEYAYMAGLAGRAGETYGTGYYEALP